MLILSESCVFLLCSTDISLIIYILMVLFFTNIFTHIKRCHWTYKLIFLWIVCYAEFLALSWTLVWRWLNEYHHFSKFHSWHSCKVILPTCLCCCSSCVGLFQLRFLVAAHCMNNLFNKQHIMLWTIGQTTKIQQQTIQFPGNYGTSYLWRNKT